MRMSTFAVGAVAALLASPLQAGDTVRLSQNLSDSIEFGTIAGISATEPLTTHDNTWWRLFHRSQFEAEGPIHLTSVRFGVEQASSSAGWQPIVVTLFEVEADFFGEFKLEQIHQVDEFIANQEMSHVTINVDAMLSADRGLAVAIAPADFGALGAEGDVFFIGTNRGGETAPSMISCPSAGNSEPTPYRSIAEEAAGLSIVMTVLGETACPGDCDGSGDLNFFDFLCFTTAFSAGDAAADCDGSGSLDVFDMVCFQDLFTASCE